MQHCADDHDGAQPAKLLERRRLDAADDVGADEELEGKDYPVPELNP